MQRATGTSNIDAAFVCVSETTAQPVSRQAFVRNCVRLERITPKLSAPRVLEDSWQMGHSLLRSSLEPNGLHKRRSRHSQTPCCTSLVPGSSTLFSETLYRRLSHTFGHIAHYDRNGFWEECSPRPRTECDSWSTCCLGDVMATRHSRLVMSSVLFREKCVTGIFYRD